MKALSGVHGGFKVTKLNKFSGVQGTLKPWLTMVAINFKSYLTVFLRKKAKYYSLFHTWKKQPFIGYSPDWMTFWKTAVMTRKKKPNKWFSNSAISA